MKHNCLLLIIFTVVVDNFIVDNYLPSIIEITQYFGTHIEYVQTTVSIEFIGFAIGAFLSGIYYIDFGYRRTYFSGLFILFCGSILCSLGLHLFLMYLGRIIEGFGAGCTFSLAFVLLTTSFQGRSLIKALSIIGLVVAIMPSISPFTGALIQEHYSWQINFTIQSILILINLAIAIPVLFKLHYGPVENRP